MTTKNSHSDGVADLRGHAEGIARGKKDSGTATPARILLVEDDRREARLLEELPAETAPRFEIETVPCLADAVERLKSVEASVDAVLLDLGRPDGQGLATLRTLQSAAPGMAIVVLAPAVDGGLALEAVKAGAQHCLPKEQVSADLLARVIDYARERKHTEEGLRRLEAMRDVAERVAGVGNWTWDLVTQRTSWSPEMFRLWDIDPDDFDGDVMPILTQRVHPDDLPALLETTGLVLETGDPTPVEFRLILRDGTERIVSAQATAECDANGNVVAITGYYQDVSERRRAERAEKASQTFLDSVVEHSPHAMWISDDEGTLIRLNQACRDLLQITDAEVVGKYNVLADNLVEEQGHLPAVQRVFEAGETARFLLDYPSARLEGFDLEHDVDLHLEVTMSPVLDESGNVAHAIIQHVDITERVRAEKALRKSERRLRRFYEAGLVGVIFWTLDGRITEANDKFLEMVGYTREELEAGRIDWIGITPPEYAERDERALSELRVTGATAAPLEKEYLRKDGTRLPVLVASATTDERRCEGVAFVLDISERRRAEEERARLESQLGQALKMESVGRLAGGVAHDFNNMLGVILGHAELALEQVNPSDPLHSDLSEIRRAAERSTDLTRQLLAFARRQTVAPQVLDLNETVAGMLNMLERLIGEDIELLWRPDPDLWPVKVDPSQIDQLLTNLCANARDAISDVGRVIIETGKRTFDEAYCARHPGSVPGDYVRLSVTDDGSGIDQETMAHLFEPFFTTKGVGRGIGLGLPTVYGIVKQNDGFIDVQSEPGQDTTFTIYLPRHAAQADKTGGHGQAQPVARGHETILLVEDEPAILDLTARMLARQGYLVLSAGTPGEALRLARGHQGEIHLVMTDVVMPEMNGRDLAESLLFLYPQIGRLFMSGYPADVIAHHGVLDEGVHFIQKPFTIKDLAAKVRGALDDA